MVTLTREGAAAFRIYLPHAGCVELIGDFTDWQASPVSMCRDEDGWWSVDLPIDPGEHRFSYLVDGAYWMPDYAASGVEHTAAGPWVSRLRIPGGAFSIDRPTPGRSDVGETLDPLLPGRDDERLRDLRAAEALAAETRRRAEGNVSLPAGW